MRRRTETASDGAARLQDAIQRKDVKSVTRILEEEPALARRRLPAGVSPFMLAAYLRTTPVMAAVRAHLDAIDIFEACAIDDADRLGAILAADPNAHAGHSGDGWTPLHLAAHFGRTGAMRILLDAGANVAAVSTNKEANTPLHAAAAGGSLDAVIALLDRGCAVDARAAGGHTPLHIAAGNGFEPIVRALLAAGADATAADGDGRTPRQVAVAHEADEVLPLLPTTD